MNVADGVRWDGNPTNIGNDVVSVGADIARGEGTFVDAECSLLRSVGEVVIPGGDVVPASDLGGLLRRQRERSTGVVQLFHVTKIINGARVSAASTQSFGGFKSKTSQYHIT